MNLHSLDHVLQQIGSLGIYQTRLLFILSWVLLFNVGYPYLLLTFLIYEPPWRCATNSSVCTVPQDIKPGDEHYQLRCDIPRDQWFYTGERSSVITEFDLICDKSALSVVSPTLFFVGTLVSDCFCGILSDKIGRKPVMVVFAFFVSLFSVGAAFSREYWLYTACRFLVGLSYSSTFIPLYTLSTEFVGVNHRHISGTVIWFGWAFTVMLLAGIAYLFKSWRTVTLAGAVPGFAIVILWWFIPESMRFLLLKEKTLEAEKLLKKIAKTNRREYPSDYHLNELKIFSRDQRRGSPWDLFRTKKMLHVTVSLFFISLTATIVYLAVTITSPSLGGNIYLNVFLVGLIEIPANLIGMVVIKRFGRRNVIAVSLIVAASGALFVILLTMYDTGHQGYLIGRIATSLLAKMASVITYITVTLFAAECYPSIIRSTGFAVATIGSDIGSTFSPFIIKLDRFNPVVPYGVIGGVALLAGIVCLTLKETGHTPTRETLDDESHLKLTTLQTEGEFSDQTNRPTEKEISV